MNYYEQIQKAIDYIELNIENKIELQRIANEACITIPENFKNLDDDIYIKEIPEGKYAVTCVNGKCSQTG